jgi:hypothetical protein
MATGTNTSQFPTSSRAPIGSKPFELPPLAQYRSLDEYNPAYADFVVWSGWITTWHGIVVNYDNEAGELHVIFSNVPFLLFTLNEQEMKNETRMIPLSKIKSAAKGAWAIHQHDYTKNASIWYI